MKNKRTLTSMLSVALLLSTVAPAFAGSTELVVSPVEGLIEVPAYELPEIVKPITCVKPITRYEAITTWTKTALNNGWNKVPSVPRPSMPAMPDVRGRIASWNNYLTGKASGVYTATANSMSTAGTAVANQASKAYSTVANSTVVKTAKDHPYITSGVVVGALVATYAANKYRVARNKKAYIANKKARKDTKKLFKAKKAKQAATEQFQPYTKELKTLKDSVVSRMRIVLMPNGAHFDNTNLTAVEAYQSLFDLDDNLFTLVTKFDQAIVKAVITKNAATEEAVTNTTAELLTYLDGKLADLELAAAIASSIRGAEAVEAGFARRGFNATKRGLKTTGSKVVKVAKTHPKKTVLATAALTGLAGTAYWLTRK